MTLQWETAQNGHGSHHTLQGAGSLLLRGSDGGLRTVDTTCKIWEARECFLEKSHDHILT